MGASDKGSAAFNTVRKLAEAEEGSPPVTLPSAQQIHTWQEAYALRPRVCDLEDVVYAGTLLKKATITGRWVARWFVLPKESDFLYYFESAGPTTSMKGLICLAGATIMWEGDLG